MSTADYSAQLQREADWQRQLMQDRQMRDNPGMSQAGAGGWEMQPDGNYRRMVNGITQTMPAGMLAGNMRAQGMAQQVSNPATIGGNTDYVGQLKALLGERQQSAGAGSVPLTNPYEQRLQELMSNPDAIANTSHSPTRLWRARASRRSNGRRRPRACCAAATRWRHWQTTGKGQRVRNTATRLADSGR